MNDTIEHLNILWSILLQLYEKKESLPLGSFNSRYYLINGRREDQEVEIWNWISQWEEKLTLENLAALATAENNIASCRLKLNSVLIKLSLKDFVIVPIDEFVSADLLLFSTRISSLASKLELVKRRKKELLQISEFENLCILRNEEKEILNLVYQEFQNLYPGVYFKRSWFKENEIICLPSGTHEMRALLKRAARNVRKNN